MIPSEFPVTIDQITMEASWYPQRITQPVLIVTPEDRILLPQEIENYRYIEYTGEEPEVAPEGGYRLQAGTILVLVEAFGEDWDQDYIVCLEGGFPGEELDLQVLGNFERIAARRGWSAIGL